jgi:hypothetical protein
MAPSSRSSKTPSTLSGFVDRHLNMYVLAATATGVGTAALTQPAEAKIVYTKTHEVVQGQGSIINIDLNHDGTTDFWIAVASVFDNSGEWLGAYRSSSASPNQVFHTSKGDAAAYPAGVRVGSKEPQKRPPKNIYFGNVMEYVDGLIHKYGGPWLDVKERYLGLSFVVDGKTHYGWARLNTSVGHNGVRGTLTGYAYETIPNKPIVTGDTKGPDEPVVEPASLGHLALGRK